MRSSAGISKNSIYVVMAVVFIGIAGAWTAHMQTASGAADGKPQAAPMRSTSECASARARASLTSETPEGPALGQMAGTLTIGEGGEPAAFAIVQFVRVSPAPAALTHTVADEQGRWTAKGLTDGRYLVVFDPPTVVGCEAPPEALFVAKRTEVELAGGDVRGFDTRADRGGRISGKVEMEGGEPIPDNLTVLPSLGEGPGYPPARIAPVQKDGTFAISGVPVGNIELRVFVYGRPHDHRIISLSAAGGAPLDRLEIKEGGEIKDVRVRLARVK